MVPISKSSGFSSLNRARVPRRMKELKKGGGILHLPQIEDALVEKIGCR